MPKCKTEDIMEEAEEEKPRNQWKLEKYYILLLQGEKNALNWWKRLRCASFFMDMCSPTCSTCSCTLWEEMFSTPDQDVDI